MLAEMLPGHELFSPAASDGPWMHGKRAHYSTRDLLLAYDHRLSEQANCR